MTTNAIKPLVTPLDTLLHLDARLDVKHWMSNSTSLGARLVIVRRSHRDDVAQSVPNQHTLEVNGRPLASTPLEHVILVDDLGGKDGEVASTVGLSTEMEFPSLQVSKRLQAANSRTVSPYTDDDSMKGYSQDAQEGINIYSSFLTRPHLDAARSIRQSDANRLIDKDDVGLRVPRVWVRLGTVAIGLRRARSQFHEESHTG